METLPKDIRFEIAMNLSPPDLINLCLSEKKQSQEICASKDFWRRKLEKDYPEEFLDFYEKGIPVRDPKSTYITRFTEISKSFEEFIPEFIRDNFGTLSKYLNKQYEKDLYVALFKIYTEITIARAIDETDQMDIITDYLLPLVPENCDEFKIDPYAEAGELMKNLLFTYLLNSTRLKFMKKAKDEQGKI
jgi:hypothetical protein